MPVMKHRNTNINEIICKNILFFKYSNVSLLFKILFKIYYLIYSKNIFVFLNIPMFQLF